MRRIRPSYADAARDCLNSKETGEYTAIVLFCFKSMANRCSRITTRSAALIRIERVLLGNVSSLEMMKVDQRINFYVGILGRRY